MIEQQGLAAKRCVRPSIHGRWVAGLVAVITVWAAQAAVSVNDRGQPNYSYSIKVPPGIGGMAPKLFLAYGGQGDGKFGHGWSLGGTSAIRRCAPTREVDGSVGTLRHDVNDKLCLDGQRLIQTDSNGTPLAFPQSGDASGASTQTAFVREFRLERDSTVRVRGYGYLASRLAGPSYFKVWRKSGSVATYGYVPTGPTAFGTVVRGQYVDGFSAVMVWPMVRESDAAGNSVDYSYNTNFQYITDPANLALSRVAYRTANNGGEIRVDFVYAVSLGSSDGGFYNYTLPSANVADAYFRGTRVYDKNPARQINITSTTTAITTISTIRLDYTFSSATKRLLLASIKECVDASATKCSSPAQFSYGGANLSYSSNATVASSVLGEALSPSSGCAGAGVLLGDFNGDGRTDILRWGNCPNASMGNKLFLSNSTTGIYQPVTPGTGAGQFNIDGKLFDDPLPAGSDSCNYSMVADFDGDGLDDVLMTQLSGPTCSIWGVGGGVWLYRSNGDGSFSKIKAKNAATQQEIALARRPGVLEIDSMYNSFAISAFANFIVGDFNGDGKLDIASISAMQGAAYRSYSNYVIDGISCGQQSPIQGLDAGCGVTLWLGRGDGTFDQSLPDFFRLPNSTFSWVPYVPPGFRADRANDLDGDGFADIESAPIILSSNYSGDFDGLLKKAYSGTAGGNFTSSGLQFPTACLGQGVAIDFNGDGLNDDLCLQTGIVNSATGTSFVQVQSGIPATGGLYQPPSIEFFDLNGDGQADYLMAGGNSGTAIKLSAGVAYSGVLSFWDATAQFGALSTALSPVNGYNGLAPAVRSYRVGNFSGRSATEFLLIGTSAWQNELLTRDDGTPADVLVSVTDSLGLVTTLKYEPLTATSRYVSDRRTANAGAYPNKDNDGVAHPRQAAPSRTAVYRKVNTTPPLAVVVTKTEDSGVGTAKRVTEYAYRGYKVNLLGRGSLGFREIRRQSDAPDGVSKITQLQQNLQRYPYTGNASVSETYVGALSPISAAQTGVKVARVENVYCDTRSAAGAELAATVSAPCPTTSKIQRPYLRKSTQAGWDLSGAALPTTVTTATYTGDYPTQVQTDTTGTGPAGAQSFTKQVVNEYFADNVGGDNWLLGLLKKSTTTSTVPNALAATTTSAGSAAKATATAGP